MPPTLPQRPEDRCPVFRFLLKLTVNASGSLAFSQAGTVGRQGQPEDAALSLNELLVSVQGFTAKAEAKLRSGLGGGWLEFGKKEKPVQRPGGI